MKNKILLPAIVRRLIFGLGGCAVLFFVGCATTGEFPTKTTGPATAGIYHKMQKGETLWRVAQAYNVSIDNIISANRIPNAALVEEGQLIFVPGVESVQKISAPTKVDANFKEFAWPLTGRVVDYFGERKGNGIQKGIAIAASTGSGTKVCAARQGKVIFADYLSGYAYTVMVDHEDGFVSVYSQNSKLLVRLGNQVNKGDSVAELGKKSILHFEIRRNTLAENPLHYLPKI